MNWFWCFCSWCKHFPMHISQAVADQVCPWPGTVQGAFPNKPRHPLHKPQAAQLTKRGLWQTFGETSELLSLWHSMWSAAPHALCKLDTKAGWKISTSTTLSSTFPRSAISPNWSHVPLLSNMWHLTQNISLLGEGWASASQEWVFWVGVGGFFACFVWFWGCWASSVLWW